MKPHILFLLAITLTLTACKTRVLGVEIGFQTPTSQPAAITVSEATSNPPTQASHSPTPQAASLPVYGTVCFNGDLEGNLRVRECPGLACREIGLLASGDEITTTGERKDSDESTWLRLTAPIDGWANSRYICGTDDKQ